MPAATAAPRRRWRWSTRRWCCMPACTRSAAGAGRRGRRWRAAGAALAALARPLRRLVQPARLPAARRAAVRRAGAQRRRCLAALRCWRCWRPALLSYADRGGAALPARARAVARGLGAEQRRRGARRAAGGACCSALGLLRPLAGAARALVRRATAPAALALLVLWPVGAAVPDAGAAGPGPGGRASCARPLAGAVRRHALGRAASHALAAAARPARAAACRRCRRRWSSLLGLLAPCLVAFSVARPRLAARGCWSPARCCSALRRPPCRPR